MFYLNAMFPTPLMDHGGKTRLIYTHILVSVIFDNLVFLVLIYRKFGADCKKWLTDELK